MKDVCKAATSIAGTLYKAYINNGVFLSDKILKNFSRIQKLELTGAAM